MRSWTHTCWKGSKYPGSSTQPCTISRWIPAAMHTVKCDRCHDKIMSDLYNPQSHINMNQSIPYCYRDREPMSNFLMNSYWYIWPLWQEWPLEWKSKTQMCKHVENLKKHIDSFEFHKHPWLSAISWWIATVLVPCKASVKHEYNKSKQIPAFKQLNCVQLWISSFSNLSEKTGWKRACELTKEL